MSTIETLEVKTEFTTLDLLLWRRFGFETRGAVEEAYALNRDLAELGPYLPVGTRVEIEIPDIKTEPPVRVRRLWG